ncbi:MAG TPA: hypothetical protein VFS71_09580, partial [Flavobacterium sp.]|uniref:hypothetical protein n=1 Tax=Flavobacterium sp. TaxID=239 RepID=UPI002DB5590D
MKKLLLLMILITSQANSQSKREQYAKDNDNYYPGTQVSLLAASDSYEIGVSYTDILTYGVSFERTQFDTVNDEKSFYAIYGTLGGEYKRVTVTVKMGGTSLKQMNAENTTIQFAYGGALEVRIRPNIGI